MKKIYYFFAAVLLALGLAPVGMSLYWRYFLNQHIASLNQQLNQMHQTVPSLGSLQLKLNKYRWGYFSSDAVLSTLPETLQIHLNIRNIAKPGYFQGSLEIPAINVETPTVKMSWSGLKGFIQSTLNQTVLKQAVTAGPLSIQESTLGYLKLNGLKLLTDLYQIKSLIWLGECQLILDRLDFHAQQENNVLKIDNARLTIHVEAHEDKLTHQNTLDINQLVLNQDNLSQLKIALSIDHIDQHVLANLMQSEPKDILQMEQHLLKLIDQGLSLTLKIHWNATPQGSGDINIYLDFSKKENQFTVDAQADDAAFIQLLSMTGQANTIDAWINPQHKSTAALPHRTHQDWLDMWIKSGVIKRDNGRLVFQWVRSI